jgi:hypothetical protein
MQHRSVPVLASIAASLALAACPAEPKDQALAFEPVAACVRVSEPTEQVFRSADELRAFFARRGASGSEPSVDFATRMVAARFDGTGSACTGFVVDKAELRDGTVVLSLTRQVSPNPCIAVVAHPQILVAIERRDAPVEFRIRQVSEDPRGRTRPCL